MRSQFYACQPTVAQYVEGNGYFRYLNKFGTHASKIEAIAELHTQEWQIKTREHNAYTRMKNKRNGLNSCFSCLTTFISNVLHI